MKWRMSVIVLVLWVAGFPSTVFAAARVFLLAGQSNMGGCGLTSELVGALDKYHEPQGRVRIWNYVNSQWATNPDLSNGGSFGPEISFGYQMQEAFPNDDIYLVKMAFPSTSLYWEWKPGDEPGWCYAMFKSTAQAAIQNLIDANLEPQVAGMLWMQGEHDAANPAWAPSYQQNLINFIATVRKDFSAPDMPFVLGRIIRGYGSDEDNSIVRTAQETVPTLVGNTFWVDTDDLQLSNNPPLHYGTQGQIDLGTRFADKLSAAPEPNASSLLLIGAFAIIAWRCVMPRSRSESAHCTERRAAGAFDGDLVV